MAFSDLSFDSALADRLAWQQAGDDRPVFVEETGHAVLPDAFDTLVEGTAAWLLDQGITAGDRVAVWLPNKLEWMMLLFGCARIGATVAAVNTRYRTAELSHILSSSGARMLIFDAKSQHSDFYGMIGELDFSKLPDLKALVSLDPNADRLAPVGGLPVQHFGRHALPGRTVTRTGTADSPLILFTTSGTTNLPKLVLHLQRTVGWHANQCVSAFGFDEPTARYMAVMPFCGVFGIVPTLTSIASGAPIYLNEVFNLGLALKTAKDNAITHMFGSDDMFVQMWETDKSAFDVARICGFASFTPGIEEKLARIAATGVPLAGLYGASELNALYSIQSLDLPVAERLRGGGQPAAGKDASIRVRNPETGELCPANEVGILEFRTAGNFVGYYRNPEATEKAIDEEGYFNSGDAGYLREDGSFVYLARNGDFLRLSGFLTDPKEIEEVIEGFPGVEKCQVVGIPVDGKTRTFAFVVSENGPLEEAAILEQASARLAHYKIPVRIIQLDAFPTTESANGLKIQKNKLREQAEQIITAGD
ncbi:AMP-binding protein [Sneathiella chinensis]|uniref:Acyl-CoA synthetase n=1 Tax=Sneathiella chinensis TaxID=349750 RepID=A0ABQ5TYS5_9PROT|nr:AMP-binding protein [Sneathiella chinensis]GLQ05132.1 acyl-CoA synthetase [Sneathiella chinensis]